MQSSKKPGLSGLRPITSRSEEDRSENKSPIAERIERIVEEQARQSEDFLDDDFDYLELEEDYLTSSKNLDEDEQRLDQMDRQDSDIEAYIKPYLETWRKQITIEGFDVNTTSGARDAIAEIDKKLEALEQQRQVAQALKALLDAKRSS